MTVTPLERSLTAEPGVELLSDREHLQHAARQLAEISLCLSHCAAQVRAAYLP